jgi:hypothetical protein
MTAKMRYFIAAATILTACSDGSNGQPARVLDAGTNFPKAPITMVTQAGITLTMNYGVEYHNHSSNKPSEVWYITPVTFEVTGIDPSSRARIVFTNFISQTSGCGMGNFEYKETYFVDPKEVDGKMIGNLSSDGSFIGNDGKSYAVSVNPPATRRAPYCVNQQSKKQLVSLVVDGIWLNAREIQQNGRTTQVEGDVHDFELHLESQ